MEYGAILKESMIIENKNYIQKRHKIKSAVVLCIILFFFLVSGRVYAGQDAWAGIAMEIEIVLHDAMKLYETGKANDAMEKAADAYFGIFEGEKANMEIAVRRHISLKKATELEKGFGDLRKAMFNKAPLSDVKKQTVNLIDALRNTAKELDRRGVGLDMSKQ